MRSPNAKRAEHEQEERHVDGKARIGAAQRIEHEGRRFTIDDGKRGEKHAKRNDQQAENELAPHGHSSLNLDA